MHASDRIAKHTAGGGLDAFRAEGTGTKTVFQDRLPCFTSPRGAATIWPRSSPSYWATVTPSKSSARSWISKTQS